jgi:hypothetical protein
MSFSSVALTSRTGIETRPNETVPFHTVWGTGALPVWPQQRVAPHHPVSIMLRPRPQVDRFPDRPVLGVAAPDVSDPRGTVEDVSTSTATLLVCTDCGELTEFWSLPVAEGFDAGERMCVVCGQARWLPPAGVPGTVAAAVAA